VGLRAQDLDELSDQVRSGSLEQKRSALSVIRARRTESASRSAIPGLSDPNEVVRSMAAAAVVYLPPDESSRLLGPLLNDKGEFVRREAVFALGEIRSRVTTTKIIEMLQHDRSNLVRSAASVALGKIGDTLAVDALVATLKTKPRSEDEYLRRSAAHSLGQIAETVRGANPQTATPQNFLPEKFKRIITSASATGLVPAYTAAVAVLLKVAKSTRETADTRREAAYALGSIGDPSSISFLKANITSNDNYMAEICREALLKMPKPE
jgi:HEAT repeat protein